MTKAARIAPPGSMAAHGTLLKACRDLLIMRGVPCFRIQQKASQRRDGTWYAGSDVGAPDLIGCLPGGRVLFIEVKTGKGRATMEQIGAIGDWTKAGAACYVIRDIGQLQAELDRLMPRRVIGNRGIVSEF